MTSKRVCVYCASSDNCAKKYLDTGRQLGEALARNNLTVVYGGARNGVMGAVADGALDVNGKVVGYFPKCIPTEILHTRLTELHEVGTMHERKCAMMMNSDVVTALPGGTGTFDELMEAITWKRLGLIKVPIFIINIDGYYDPLLALFENMFDAGFMSRNEQTPWIVVQSIDELIKKL